MADALVTELLDSIASFQEDALCPICEGHGAMSAGARDIVIEMMPQAVLKGLKVSTNYDSNKRATLMTFSVTGFFGCEDHSLVNQEWEKNEAELRSAFERFLGELKKGTAAMKMADKLAKLDAEARRAKPFGPGATPPLNPVSSEDIQAKMKEQELALKHFLQAQQATKLTTEQQIVQQQMQDLQQQQSLGKYGPSAADSWAWAKKSYEGFNPAKEQAIVETVSKDPSMLEQLKGLIGAAKKKEG
jgi:hypothetical protein